MWMMVTILHILWWWPYHKVPPNHRSTTVGGPAIELGAADFGPTTPPKLELFLKIKSEDKIKRTKTILWVNGKIWKLTYQLFINICRALQSPCSRCLWVQVIGGKCGIIRSLRNAYRLYCNPLLSERFRKHKVSSTSDNKTKVQSVQLGNTLGLTKVPITETEESPQVGKKFG